MDRGRERERERERENILLYTYRKTDWWGVGVYELHMYPETIVSSSGLQAQVKTSDSCPQRTVTLDDGMSRAEVLLSLPAEVV